MKKIFTIILLCAGWSVRAQLPVITDNLMLPKKDLAVGVFYGNDTWKSYWEGTLKRQNENIGTITTQSATIAAAYGISQKLTATFMLPYVWTRASGGTLHPMQGLQDASLSLKYNFFKKDFEKSSISFIVLGLISNPVSNYSKDFMPLSIGMGCFNASGRATVNYSYKTWFITGSGAYSWRGNVYLDRPAYYTNGHLYNTDEVQMPNTFDFIFRIGYKKPTWHVDVFYTQQNTLGGGDIQRQDMPFVSDRFNAGKVGASTLWFVPNVKNLGIRAWGDYVVSGRNVGQSTAVFAGVVYRIGPRTTAN